jgi:hypothetical protein
MTDAMKSKKPAPVAGAQAPETHKQTEPVEKKISPQHNTTEPYGKSDDKARKATAKYPSTPFAP